MTITQTEFDKGREWHHKGWGKKAINLEISGSQIGYSAYFTMYGRVKNLKSFCPTLVTDTTYTVTIEDKDGIDWFTSDPLTHNQNAKEILSADEEFTAVGDYRIRYNFPTANQTISAGDIQTFVAVSD
jgi:hypothetical protein